MNVKRRFLIGLAALLLPALASAQTKPAQRRSDAPTLSAARSIVAGAPLSIFLNNTPQGARLAIHLKRETPRLMARRSTNRHPAGTQLLSLALHWLQ